MDLNLKNKVALVTGAGSQIGVGKAIALTLAKEGCDTIINDIDLAGAEQTAAQVEALGRKAMVIKADVSSSLEVNEMVKTALARFGKIDILVNNAGTMTFKPFLDMTEMDWNRDINTDFKGTLNCTKAVLPCMIERKYGKIVNISSGSGISGGLHHSVYSAVKGGIITFTKGIAREMGPLGINVNSIAPGHIPNTGFERLASNASPELKEGLLSSVVMGRQITPQDIANAVAFIASDVACAILGQTLSVSGRVIDY